MFGIAPPHLFLANGLAGVQPGGQLIKGLGQGGSR
jgi:hypothetical protein